MQKFYQMDLFLEKFIEINQKTSWDRKRARILAILDSHFKTVENENNLYLKKFKELKGEINLNFINLLEEEMRTKLNSIRNVYSTGTPRINEKENSRIFDFGLLVSFLDIEIFTDLSLNQDKENLLIFVEFARKKINYKSFDFNNKEVDVLFSTETIYIKEYNFNEQMPKYLNVIIYNQKIKTLIGSYSLDILKLDILKPYKLILESNDDINKSSLEVAILKYSNIQIREEEAEYYKFLFEGPNYLYNFNLDNEINGLTQFKQLDQLDKYMVNKDHTSEKFFKILENNKFLRNQYYKNVATEEKKIKFINEKNQKLKSSAKLVIETNDSVLTNLNETIKKTFSENVSELILQWIQLNESSFEEILYALIISDQNSVSIYDKLKLLFDIGKMKNYLIYNEDYLTIQN